MIESLINIILLVFCLFFAIFFFYVFTLTPKNKEGPINSSLILSIMFILIAGSTAFNVIINVETDHSYLYAGLGLLLLYISSFVLCMYAKLIAGKLIRPKASFFILILSIAIFLVLIFYGQLTLNNQFMSIHDILGVNKKLPVEGPAYLWIEIAIVSLIITSMVFLFTGKKRIVLFSFIMLPFIVLETMERFSITNIYLFYNNITPGLSLSLIYIGFMLSMQTLREIYPQLRNEEISKKAISSEEILSLQKELSNLRDLIEKISDRAEEINLNKKKLDELVGEAYSAINDAAIKIKSLNDFTRTIQVTFEEREETFDFLKNNWNLYRNRLKEISKSGMEITNNIDSLTNEVGSGKELIRINLETLNHIKDSVKKLNSVVESIEDLADQTNLLSINTAIEVYHSERKGGGFSVIAEEISETALSVLNASLDISSSIQRIMENATEIEARVKIIDQIFSDFLKNIEVLFVYMTNIADIIKELDSSILNFLRELEKKHKLQVKDFQIETKVLPLLQKQKNFLDKLSNFLPALFSSFDNLQSYINIQERLEKYNESLKNLLSEKGRKDNSL